MKFTKNDIAKITQSMDDCTFDENGFIIDDTEEEKLTKTKFKKLLGDVTGCIVQHDGWCCNSCFHSIDIEGLKEDIHEYWLAVLKYRGDYPDLPDRMDLIEEFYEKNRK